LWTNIVVVDTGAVDSVGEVRLPVALVVGTG
jgi:hypothetical protein